LRVRDGRELEAFPDALIALEVGERQARIGLVPDVRGQLMTPLEMLELVFEPRAARQQPARARPADPVAERQVQAPGYLVDEVVHVGLVTAVVVAGENDPPLVVEKRPEREMNRLHAGEMTAREDVPGEKRLVAYIVWDGVASAESPPQHASALRTHLKHSLPDYMLPATFIELEQLPLTPNGKVDRRALPAPDHLRPDLDKAYVEARTVEEALLVEIWKEVLGVERVGVHDNFLELGGDSILSLRVIIKATQAGMQLTPAQLFQRQTVAELASVLPPLSLPGSLYKELSDEVPLTPIQQWFFEQNLPEQHHFNQAVLLEVPAHLEATLIERAVEELFIRHDALRLRFINVEGVWQQTVSALGGETSFSAYDFSSQTEKEQSADIERVADKIQRGLNLSEGPLAGFALIRLGEQKSSRLLIVIHHLAVDITSWRILLEDFQTACEQLSRQEEVELPARTTSFALWSQHLNRFAQSAELSAEAEYWRNVVNHETVSAS